MRTKLLLSAGLVAFGLGIVSTSVQAAPAGGLVAAIDRDAARASPVEKATWYGHRHCYWHYGHYRCWYGHHHRHWYGHHHYRKWHKYGYYRPHRHYYGHYGYRRWW
jgi:hypothetical protein